MKCEATATEMIACLKPHKKELAKLFANRQYHNSDAVLKMLE